MNSSGRIVQYWISRLDEVELADTKAVDDILSRIPSAVVPQILQAGSAAIREKLLAPVFAELEREGVVERTGRVAPNGQRIWRSLIYSEPPLPQPTDPPESDKT